MHWWQRLPQRFLEEDAQLRALVSDNTIAGYRWVKQADGQLWLYADLLVGDETQTVELRFGERYPGECPVMRPIPYGKSLSTHQFGGDGVLCLELGPDNWHSRYTAKDLLVSAWKLLALEFINSVRPIHIPSRHMETLGMHVRRSMFRVIANQLVRNALDVSGVVGEFQYAILIGDGGVVLWVTDVPSGTPLEGIPPIIAGHGKKDRGLFVHLAENADFPPLEVSALREYLKQAGLADERAAATTGLVLFLKPSSVIAYFLPSVETQSAWDVAVICDRRAEAPERRPASIAVAAETARVAIIGLGSLGSKIAVSLARSGIAQFALVDGDVFLPENVGRHDADYGLAGLMKVDAVATRIRRASAIPVKIDTFDHDLMDGSNPAIHARTVNALAHADLIIDATANPEAFNFLADLASEERRQFAWGEVFAGGLGGYVAYATPQQTPCPSCVRDAFHAHAAEWPPAPVGAPEAYAMARTDGPPIVATDADVTVIAGALASLALKLITSDLDGHPPLTLIGLQRGWIFDHAFDTHSISVRRDDFSCPRCWSRPAHPDLSLQLQVDQLLNGQ